MRLTIGFFGMMGVFLVAYSCANGNGDGGNPGNTNGAGGNTGNACPSGNCNGVCVNFATDLNNCGACGTRCAASQTCSNGACACVAGLSTCGSSCVNLSSDGSNCGACGTTCSGGQACSQGRCSNDCQTSETKCGTSCVNAQTDPLNCGQCDVRCSAGQTCVSGLCTCGGGQQRCGAQCIDVSTNAQNCGSCGHACATGQSCSGGVCSGGGGGTGGAAGTGGGNTTGTGGAAGARDSGTTVVPDAGTTARACPLTPGLISDFEEGTGTPVALAQEGRAGSWAAFHDTGAGTETVAIEASGGTATCDKWALHISGRGWPAYAGYGLVFGGTQEVPTVYNATQHSFTGIRFKAKIGAGHDSKAAVRLNLSTPATEATATGGQCAAAAGAPPCYQHPGRFLSVVPADGELTTAWKTFSYCFDRDLYPLSLPSNMTNAQRDSVGSSLLKLQFSFNLGKDYTVPVPNGTPYMPPVTSPSTPFDFWVDQVEFFTEACTVANFQSTAGTAVAFPQNRAATAMFGTCPVAANSTLFSTALSQAYATWTRRFVQGNKIVAPEQNNVTTSEAMGYGMMIAAAMGDKAAFDQFSGYVQANLDGNGLMTWTNGGGSGSATDADGDIIYAYLMANRQWPTGGYMARATPMIAAFTSRDAAGGLQSGDSPLGFANPSYFAPYAYRVFGGLASLITSGYALVNANVAAATSGLPTDWATLPGGSPVAARDTNAQVVNLISITEPVFGYDAARVPWRLGMDKCLNTGADTAAITSIVNFFAPKYGGGAQIDLLKAGWFKATGAAAPMAAPMQGSFIGPMGIAGMALQGTAGTAMRDRAFRAVLDILQNGDFNHTYFPSTVGLITALIMSGNFPTP